MGENREIIYEFLEQFEDFSRTDIESGYKNVYRPGWHPNPVQFWFNPPFDESGESVPTLSNAIFLLEDGAIMVQDVYSKLSYNLDDCLGETEANFIEAISNYSRS